MATKLIVFLYPSSRILKFATFREKNAVPDG